MTTHTHPLVHACTHTNTCAHTHTYMHTHTYTHMHTHTFTVRWHEEENKTGRDPEGKKPNMLLCVLFSGGLKGPMSGWQLDKSPHKVTDA